MQNLKLIESESKKIFSLSDNFVENFFTFPTLDLDHFYVLKIFTKTKFSFFLSENFQNLKVIESKVKHFQQNYLKVKKFFH